MPATRSPGAVLAQQARRLGGSALLTHYRPSHGERTELSWSSFANWADKTANLLDELGVDDSSTVALPVLAEAPAHWMSLVWPFALWQRGLTARVVPRDEAGGSDLVVLGPDAPAPVGLETLACSLHPWGLALSGLPAGVTDFSSEALAQPDAHADSPVDPGGAAWTDATRTVTFAELLALTPSSERVASRPATAWEATALLTRAILGGGSLVLVDGPGDLDRLAADERARVER